MEITPTLLYINGELEYKEYSKLFADNNEDDEWKPWLNTPYMPSQDILNCTSVVAVRNRKEK